MRINKKGFTLIELLAVIAILAILVVIAVPNVLNLFNDSKKNAFVTQAQSIYKTAETQYVSKQLSNVAVSKFANVGTGATELELEAADTLKYCIKFTNGAISSFSISDGTYSMAITDIDSISDIKASAIASTYAAVSACN